MTGYFEKEIRKKMISAIQESMTQGLSQKEACHIFGLGARKYRRWIHQVPARDHRAWNRILPEEKAAIIKAAYRPELMGKPLSHLYVYGHEKRAFFASISTIYRVLKEKDLVKPARKRRRRNAGYVSAHELLNQGFYLLTYDGTPFRTSGQDIVVAIPVLLLPFRYLLHIGHSLRSERGKDIRKAADEAIAIMPGKLKAMVMVHCDRGSAMKARQTVLHLEKLHGIPVHFGRPHTPDDNPWVEALNRTMKYHREAPESYGQIQDVLDWLERFPDLYNNEPHSALHYVSPREALEGKMEVILEQRKQNLMMARKERLEAYKASKLNCRAV